MNSLRMGFAQCREVEELSQPKRFAARVPEPGQPRRLLQCLSCFLDSASKGKSQRLLALRSPSISFIAAVWVDDRRRSALLLAGAGWGGE